MTTKPPSTENPTPPASAEAASTGNSGGKAEKNTSILAEHKGKLALGVAATLGLVIYYNLRQKKLPEEDPEGFARLQRIKERVKADESQAKGAGLRKSPQEETPPPEPGSGAGRGELG